ncbi:GNAT family N-acetyltransferase [Sphingomonas crusticola]|uniref:GNAT family N-acetyltransferase n=1 Tax=Sphingomonas crusticola TaxID=1697973 RepID=UPI000E26D0AC|nr:N-acetyltransferase [Sphingomonas crusticola]
MTPSATERGGWAVRRAGPDDAAALALVGGATFLETFAGLLDGAAIVAHCAREHKEAAYRAYLAGGAAAWLAETDEGRAPIGFALVAQPALPGAQPGDLELKRIYTLSRFHGRGLGKALIDAALTHARDQAAARLLLGVYKGNDRALAFYARHGFVPIAERMFDVGGKSYADQVLAKPLERHHGR